MKCPKCKGLMVREKFSDDSSYSFIGWRCVPCGEILDDVINQNRNNPLPPGRFKNKRQNRRRGLKLLIEA